ncbi:MAG: alpha-L-fucosidase [Clostridia bacterium]|nr:alpha-L-fucosidase [Clostridia bacterium]
MQIKPEQLDFLRWEFGVFFHFGIRTFNEGHRDWDEKPMALSSFNPSDLDCGEWIEAAHDAGARYAVLVCKHHDGFANWPSAYTDYSVRCTPWQNGGGDVVREFTQACRRYGLKIGLYYSPAQFGSSRMQGTQYDDYFIGQIRELLTNYGVIDYLWFDGCGCENHRFDTDRIVAEIRKCQPQILLFNLWDPDTRWIGNESGIADSPNPLIVDLHGETRFLPAECDCRMRDENWFYSETDAHTVKSPDELMGLYYYSVGRGSNLLLNIGPDRRGRLPDADKQALLRFGEIVRESFSSPIRCTAAAQAERLTLETEPQLVNHVVLAETVTDSEIQSFTIRAYPCSGSAPVCVYRGDTIGNKAICRFPTIRTGKIEISFDRDKPVSAALFYLRQFQ